MKVLVAGVQRLAGVSKKSGSPFDMCNVLVLVPVDVVNKTNLQVNGVGLKQKELPLDLAALPKFMAIPQSQFPLELELDTDARMGNFGLETVVVGFKAAGLKAAA